MIFDGSPQGDVDDQEVILRSGYRPGAGSRLTTLVFISNI